MTDVHVLVVEWNTVHFEGPARIAGMPDRCSVTATDRDAQFGGRDSIRIDCDNNRTVAGPLGGGNITIVHPNQIGDPNQ